MQAKDRIIVALDTDTLEKAGQLVEELAPYVGAFKVGLEMISSVGGPTAVEFIHSRGGQVFYDGKFNDIPNTVGAASKAVSDLGVMMFNVHVSSGMDALRAASANKGKSIALGMTVLTALDDSEAELIFGAPSKAKVLQFARDSKAAGMDGIVCSPQELEFLAKHRELDGLMRVTPGVRPAWAQVGDQKRIMTPGQAIMAGASYLVIGRPITKPPEGIGGPKKAAQKILEEIESTTR